MDRTPVFVLVETSSFSGATLFAHLVGAHPEIATVGEMNGLIARENPDTYLCSCKQRIKECKFWQSVRMAMAKRGFEFDVAHFDNEFTSYAIPFLQHLRLGSFRNRMLDSIRDRVFQVWPGENRRLKALVARNEAFIESVLEVTGKSVFVDTSKDRLRLNALRRFSTVDVRVIHLVRDVRGVVASWLRRGRRIEVSQVARQWVRRHHRHEEALGTLPQGTHLRLRYEDLCQDVSGTMNRVYRFCGVDAGVTLSDSRHFREVSHHIVGNRMRLENLSDIRVDERWRDLLTADQLKEIDRVAGVLRRRYGYC